MTQRPTQRPTPRPALQRPTMLGSVSAAPVHPQAEEAGGASGMDKLMQQFDAALQELQNDPSLDGDTREFLRQQFAQALSDVGTGENEPAGIPDRAVWMDAVEALQASGNISEGEVNDLIRQINHALQPLQRRESQLAIEFSRRMHSDGEERALAWFREESAKGIRESNTEASPPPPPQKSSNALRSDVVNSKSRHLRGPPRA
jgi:hypothetical protein